MRAHVVGEDSSRWQYFLLGRGSEDVRLYRQQTPAAPQKGKKPLPDSKADHDVPFEVTASTVEARTANHLRHIPD